MKLRIDDVDAIESKCYAPPIDAEGPTDEVCGNEATTYVSLSSGTRRYICEDHAEQVDRFETLGSSVDHPKVAVCDACQRLAPASVMKMGGRCVECEP